jgi:hypothetical protein
MGLVTVVCLSSSLSLFPHISELVPRFRERLYDPGTPWGIPGWHSVRDLAQVTASSHPYPPKADIPLSPVMIRVDTCHQLPVVSDAGP